MYREEQLFNTSKKAMMLMDLILLIWNGFTLVELEANNMP
jgi:hypothetical protein